MSARVPPKTARVWGRMGGLIPLTVLPQESSVHLDKPPSRRARGRRQTREASEASRHSPPHRGKGGLQTLVQPGRKGRLAPSRRSKESSSSGITPTLTPPACLIPSAKAEGTLKEEQGSLTWEGSQPKAAALLDPDHGSSLHDAVPWPGGCWAHTECPLHTG